MVLRTLLTNVTKFSHAEIRNFENTLYRGKSEKRKNEVVEYGNSRIKIR